MSIESLFKSINKSTERDFLSTAANRAGRVRKRDTKVENGHELGENIKKDFYINVYSDFGNICIIYLTSSVTYLSNHIFMDAVLVFFFQSKIIGDLQGFSIYSSQNTSLCHKKCIKT